MKTKTDSVYNIETLAQKAGLNRRTIHFYLQRGLLQPPHGEGRGCYYGPEHLERLRALKRLTDQRVPLAQAKDILDHPLPKMFVEQKTLSMPIAVDEPDMPSQNWARISITNGVELHIKEGAVTSQKTKDLIAALHHELAMLAELAKPGQEELPNE